MAPGTIRAATAAADPDDDPPGVCPSDHGLRVGAGSRYANWVAWVLPRMTAPAARSRATSVASLDGNVCAKAAAPARVGMPATSMMSLTPTGTPWSGPGACPAARAASRSRASARAARASRWTHARTEGSSASIRSRHAVVSATAVHSPSRIRPAASTTPASVSGAAVGPIGGVMRLLHRAPAGAGCGG